MFILQKGHQPGVYVPLRALFLVHYTFSSVKVATFWEIDASSVCHMFSLSIDYLYFLFISQFGLKSGIWL